MIYDSVPAEFKVTNRTEGDMTFSIPDDESLVFTIGPKKAQKFAANIETGEEFFITLDSSNALSLSWDGENLVQIEPFNDWKCTIVSKNNYQFNYPVNDTYSLSVTITTAPTAGTPPGIGIMIVGTVDAPDTK